MTRPVWSNRWPWAVTAEEGEEARDRLRTVESGTPGLKLGALDLAAVTATKDEEGSGVPPVLPPFFTVSQRAGTEGSEYVLAVDGHSPVIVGDGDPDYWILADLIDRTFVERNRLESGMEQNVTNRDNVNRIAVALRTLADDPDTDTRTVRLCAHAIGRILLTDASPSDVTRWIIASGLSDQRV